MFGTRSPLRGVLSRGLSGAIVSLMTAGAAWAAESPEAASRGKGTVQPVARELTATAVTMIESLIDDAMQDGAVDVSERRIILNQAKRRLAGAELAAVETRIAELPAAVSNGVGLGLPRGADDKTAAAPAAAGCGACCEETTCCGLLGNTYLFSAADAWKGPIDDNNGNNFGARIGFNSGAPLLRDRGIGGQFGMSYGVYDFHGREDGTEESSIEDQLFITAGVFKRCDLCGPCPKRVSWGLVYDHMITDNLGEDGWEIGLGQLRGQVGYALNHADEVGLMGNVHVDEDEIDGTSNDQDNVRALDMGALFWHHKWCFGADTTAYVGLAEDPGEWVFGARGEVPLNNCVSLFGAAQYILPSTSGGDEAGTSRDQFAEEFWNVSFGLAFYPCANARSRTVCGHRWMPLLPVADNGSFPLEILPGKI